MKKLILLSQKKIEKQNNIYINVFCCDNKWTYPVYLSGQKFESCMDLLLISDEYKSHYMYIKDFDRFMFGKTKLRQENIFVSVVYSVLIVKRF